MKGSFFNQQYAGAQTVDEVTVGMGATHLMYTDREAYTVQKVISQTKVIVTRDKVERIDSNGASNTQEWRYESTPLVEGKREKRCTNPYMSIIPGAQCKTIAEGGSCEGCSFYKMHKPTNGITVTKGKDGWKHGDQSFLIGYREEYYDYSF